MAYQLTIPLRVNEGSLSQHLASLTKGARDLNREFSVEETELTLMEKSPFRSLVLFFQIESFVSLTLFYSAIQFSSFSYNVHFLPLCQISGGCSWEYSYLGLLFYSTGLHVCSESLPCFSVTTAL